MQARTIPAGSSANTADSPKPGHTPPGLATRAPQNPAPAGHYAPRDPTNPQFTDAPASPWLTVPEACAVLRIGRATVYELFIEGRLTRCKLGAKTLIPRASVDRLIAELLAEAEGTRHA